MTSTDYDEDADKCVKCSVICNKFQRRDQLLKELLGNMIDRLIIEDVYKKDEAVTCHVLKVSPLEVLNDGAREFLIVKKLGHYQVRKMLVQFFQYLEKLPSKCRIVYIVHEVGNEPIYETELLLTDVLHPLPQFCIIPFLVES